MRAVRQRLLVFFSSDLTQYFSVLANPRAQESAQHSRLSLLGSCQEEGRFCLSDRSRHWDCDQTIPSGAECYRQTTSCQYQHSVWCQLWNTFSHFSIQGRDRQRNGWFFRKCFSSFSPVEGLEVVLGLGLALRLLPAMSSWWKEETRWRFYCEQKHDNKPWPLVKY